MNSYIGKGVLTVLAATIVCMIAIDFAEAQRRGGGGRGMRGGGMHRGGAAASGSFQRSRARPQRRDYGSRQGDFSRSRPSDQRQNRNDQRQTDRDQRQTDRDQRYDDRQSNRDERWDQRQENIDERQKFAKEVHNDREEWYEDRWRGGYYVSVSSWNSMNCRYTTVVREGITYYNCNGTYYERVYHGGQVVYIISN